MSIQRYTVLIVALMVMLTVIYVNYTHTSKCTQNGVGSSGDEDTKMYLESLNKRLLEAESQVSVNILIAVCYE